MDPSPKNAFRGFPFEFLQEVCVMYAMGLNPSHTLNCDGFQMVVTEKAEDDQDEIKHIKPEDMDDAPVSQLLSENIQEDVQGTRRIRINPKESEEIEREDDEQHLSGKCWHH